MVFIFTLAEKGKSAFLLKGSAHVKRKRSEIEEVKDEEGMLNKDKYGFLRAVKKLKTEKD